MKHRFRDILGLSCLVILLSACSSSATGIEILDPWARPADSGANSAVYFEIQDRGQGDILLSASSEIAEKTELHRSIIDIEGNARMEHQEHVEIPGGEKISFVPGGLHVMLINLDESFVVGDTFDLLLEFEKAGEVIINVSVQNP